MKDDFGYMYVLDYSNCTISEIKLDKEDDIFEDEEILDKYGFKMSNCEYMYSDNKLEIKIVSI